MNTVNKDDSLAEGFQIEAQTVAVSAKSKAKEESDPDGGVEKKYRLSISNKLLVAVALVLYVGLFLAYSDKSPQQTTVFLASFTTVLLYPLLLSWIVWRLSGKKVELASFVLNIAMAIIFVGQVDVLRNITAQGIP